MANVDVALRKACAKCGEIKPATAEYYGKAKGKQERFGAQCRVCDTRRTQKWRAENPEAAKARNRLVYERRKDEAAEYGKRYREANKDRIAGWQRDWLTRNRDKWYNYRAEWNRQNRQRNRGYAQKFISQNPDRYRLQLRKMYEKHRAKRLKSAAAWRAANRQASRAIVSAYRARKRGAGGRHTAADIARQLKGQKGRCWWCQKKVGKYHADHRFSLKAGGSNGPENIVISCPSCNQRKAARMPWEIDNPRLL